MGWLLAVHLGAGRYGESVESEAAYVALLHDVLEKGRELMSARTGDCDVTHAVCVASGVVGFLERHELTNCGRGANLTERGVVECEASVACGKTRLVGACAGVRGVAEPSALARKLLARALSPEDDGVGREPPLVVVGDGARAMAEKLGLEVAKEHELHEYQVTRQAQRQWRKWHDRCAGTAEAVKDADDERLDTVGAVCVDGEGNVAAAISSGGVLYKVPGRVGLAGCPRMGCDARNRSEKPEARSGRKRRRGSASQNGFAVACTGRGEHFIRSSLVSSLTGRLREGDNVDDALRASFEAAKEDNGGVPLEGGALALAVSRIERASRPRTRRETRTDARANTTEDELNEHISLVQIGVALTTPCMAVGFVGERMAKPQVEILRQPDEHERQLVVHVSCLGI